MCSIIVIAIYSLINDCLPGMHSLRTGNSNCCLSCDHDMVMHCERAAWSHDGLVRDPAKHPSV